MLSLLNFNGVVTALINLLNKLLDFFLPVWYNVIKLLEWFASKFWQGLVIVLTNLITLFVIAPLMIGAGYYGYKNCEPYVIKSLRKDYKFIPRKQQYRNTKSFFEDFNPWKR